MSAALDRFERIRADIRNYEKEALELSSVRALENGLVSPRLTREELIHLVGSLWKLSSAYKNYTLLLERSLVEIRQNMGQKRGEEKEKVIEEKKVLEVAAMSLDQLIASLQKIEDITNEYKEENPW